jgi:nitrogen fixation protein NifU and related proteins
MDQETYSDIILELYKHPMNEGEIKNADIKAQGGNPVCGDAIRLSISLTAGKITDAQFTGNGCAISQASASLLTDMVKGKTVEEALAITPEHVFENLGGIIQTRIKCALLGLHVLKEGLKKYLSEKKPVRIDGITI